tara:strand:+ start:5956 stop:6465 length:510 start_codon:yes stop_codon:yes gene_type:complete
MDQQIDNKVELKVRLANFFKHNKKKFIFLISFLLIFIFLIFLYNNHKEKKNIEISEQFINAGLLLSSQEYEESKKIFERIIFSENKFYSKLALNTIIEKKLEKNNQKILEYFKIIENLNYSQDQKDLILLKKALFLINIKKSDEGKKILKKLIESNSKVKTLAEEVIQN